MSTPPTTRRRFPAVFASVVVLAVLLGLGTFWLLRPTPAGPTVLHAGTSHYAVVVTVENPRTGLTGIALEVADRSGAPVPAAAVDVGAVMPTMGHSAPPAHAGPAGGGRYRAEGVNLAMAGQWELQVSIDAPDGVDRLTLPIVVGG